MASISTNVKTAILKGIEALGKGASTIGTAAQQKLSEMDITERRTELRREIPVLVAELARQGVELPEALAEKANELVKLEDQLKANREQNNEAQAQKKADLDAFVENAGKVVDTAVDAVEGFVKETIDKVNTVIEDIANDDETIETTEAAESKVSEEVSETTCEESPIEAQEAECHEQCCECDSVEGNETETGDEA